MKQHVDLTITILDQKNAVYRLALSILKNSHEAEDIVQEVHFALWKQRKKLAEIRSIRAFALTVARNLCLNQLKKKRLTSLNSSNHDSSVVAASLENIDKLNRVHSIIRGLPEDQSTALLLRGVEGLEIAEIADILKTSQNNVHVLLHRARKRLKEEYNKLESYGIKE